MKITVKDSALALGVFVFCAAFFASLIVSSDPISVWVNPKLAAPYGNVSVPLTIGKFDQIKVGAIGISGNLGEFGNTVLTGKVRIADGSQSEFYALVSDADGNATWKSLPVRPVATVKKFELATCPEGSTKMTDRGLAYCGYVISTGASSFCREGDIRIAAVDTGTSAHKGGNHGISLVAPNGCVGWEGPSNFGGPGCAVTCRTTTVFK